MPWRFVTGCPRERGESGRQAGGRTGVPSAMGAGAGCARPSLPGRDGQTQQQRSGDHEPLRRRQDGCRHRLGYRADLWCDGACGGRDGVRRHGAREELAGDEGVSDLEPPPGPDEVESPLTREAPLANGAPQPGPPLWLLMELTYRCPLHCVFCYNPTEFAATGPELETDGWLRVLRGARALGAVQLGLSGGEP